jgi:hypothetical protein
VPKPRLSTGFAGGPLSNDPAQLGFIALDLAASFPEWIRRRKTTYRFLDERTVQLHRSIDLVLPDLDWFAWAPKAGQTIYVPLDIFQKETLAGFTIANADGAAVSLLNTHENGTLATEGFSALVDRYADSEPPGSFRQSLGEIIFAVDADAGNRAFAAAEELRKILPDDQYEALLEDLGGGFLILVPLEYQPDANHIFKIDWSVPYSWSKPGLGGTLRSVAASLGLADKELNFPELSIGFSQGTHFEFRAPESVRNLETILAVDQYDPDRGRVALERRRVVYAKPQANVNVSVRSATEAVASRSDLGSVTVKLRPRRGGVFLAIVIVAWLTTLVLAAIASRVGQLDAQTSSAVVLVLPAVLAAYLAREGEHAIAGRLRAGIRVGGLLISALAFAAGILIGVGELREPARTGSQAIECRQRTPPLHELPRPFDRLDCRLGAADAPRPEANPDLQATVWSLAGSAGLIALVLSAGLWSTHRATRAAGAKTDESNPSPPGYP